jgi:PHS family inorganic phosphate transporter-like MFS transporter
MSKKVFENLDRMRLSFNHIKVWYTAGMGFFTDAYDLFNITTILIIFNMFSLPGFDIHNALVTGLLASSSISTAVIGQLLFGFLGDIMGRKTVYGVEATLMALGALLSAFSPNVYWLIACRSLMGIGIGGDYPISATIMSEYSNVKDRGKLTALVFANQGIGSVAAVFVSLASVIAFPPDLAWRVIAAVGAIPAATVIYLRRKTPETPRYSLLVKGDVKEAQRAASFLGERLEVGQAVKAKRMEVRDFLRDYWSLLLGTAGTWFIEDVALYGTGAYSGVITSTVLGPSGTVERAILYAGIPYMVGLFGYFTAVALMDRLGRRVIQTQGFLVMALIYGLVAALALTSGTKIQGFLIPSWGAMAIYAMSFYFINFGPNTTTFVIPAEVYPVRFRTTGHGISAAAGKAGAAISTFLFPQLLSFMGVKGILEMLLLLSIVGAVMTMVLVKEGKQRSLEEVSGDVLVEQGILEES